MATNNYYAIRGEREQVIVDSWEKASQLIRKENREQFGKINYKGFVSLEEAKNFLLGDDPNGIYINALKQTNKYYAYVDGSINSNNNVIGWGLAIVYNNKVVYEDCGRVDAKYVKNGQVGGELYATMEAVKIAQKMGLNDLIIVHDFEGIYKWYAKINEANTELTKGYVKYMHSVKNIRLNFVKVPSHTNIKFNELVDYLAGKANGSK